MDEQLVSPLRAIRVTRSNRSSVMLRRLSSARCFAPHDEQRLASLRDEVATELSDEDYFSILEACSVRIQTDGPYSKVLTFRVKPGRKRY
jgi:hypothetical protein